MQPGAADWSEESRLVAWTLADGAGGGLYIAFNASHRPTTLELPHWHGRSWQLVSDTGKVRGGRPAWAPSRLLPQWV
jgi:isoamylase